MSDRYRVIGLMSGTSLDGLDICLVNLEFKNRNWKFEIELADTISYAAGLKEKLKFDPNLSKDALILLDQFYGKWLGNQVNAFLTKHQLSKSAIHLIASHGHTLYHQPEQGYTKQIGGGPELFETTGISCVTDFRTQDIRLGGQGAPLVPIGDQLLFYDYAACLNLGGFANISLELNQRRIAFDICPVNIVFNHLCQELDLDYDHDGNIARSGTKKDQLLHEMNQLKYYQSEPPKSLGAEWLNNKLLPILQNADADVPDRLHTAVLHAAAQIARVINEFNLQNCLITGGGAYNSFLINEIQKRTECQLIIPNSKIVDFKEALIFGLLGVLRYRGETNVLASVTGASTDHSSGLIYTV